MSNPTDPKCVPFCCLSSCNQPALWQVWQEGTGAEMANHSCAEHVGVFVDAQARFRVTPLGWEL